MGIKKCFVIPGLIILAVLFISLSSVTAATFEVRTQDDRQTNRIPLPSPAPGNQNNTFSPNTNAYNNPYSSVYINPVTNTQPNTNYQVPLINPSTSLNTNSGDLSTWNSTYAVGNYEISPEINQSEFAVSSFDGFAQATPVNTETAMPIAENAQIERPSGLNDVNSPEINKPY